MKLKESEFLLNGDWRPAPGRTEALTQQVRDHLLGAMAGGRLRPGELLPTARELGMRWGVHGQSVGNAVRALQLMGLVVRVKVPRSQHMSPMRLMVAEGARASARARILAGVSEDLVRAAAAARTAGLGEDEIAQLCGVAYARS